MYVWHVMSCMEYVCMLSIWSADSALSFTLPVHCTLLHTTITTSQPLLARATRWHRAKRCTTTTTGVASGKRSLCSLLCYVVSRLSPVSGQQQTQARCRCRFFGRSTTGSWPFACRVVVCGCACVNRPIHEQGLTSHAQTLIDAAGMRRHCVPPSGN